MRLYECGICGSLHPWDWAGDCRDDEHRYGDEEDYAAREGVSEHEIEVYSWDERQQADLDAEQPRSDLLVCIVTDCASLGTSLLLVDTKEVTVCWRHHELYVNGGGNAEEYDLLRRLAKMSGWVN